MFIWWFSISSSHFDAVLLSMANVQNLIYLFDYHKNDGNNKDRFYYAAAPRCCTCREK